MKLLIKQLTPAAVFGLIMIGLMAIFFSLFFRAQDAAAACVIEGKKLDNCVDFIYSKAKSAGKIYPAARVAPKNTSYATRYRFVEADGEDWLDTFFGNGEKSVKLLEIFKSDPKVDFEAFYKLNLRFKISGIDGVALFREGFIVVALHSDNEGSYIIPISPKTVDKIKALENGLGGEPSKEA